ncbi:unnamed protein product [Caenorhabditis bovis]|uniref:Uncharacterized protein n=1 Tax=Caenorhabditis bovis TaxID=2654633 RepID=A0A8S1EG30_9PELO|nr:unnamed protein product [Caenorhabditis bovis]
MANKDVQIPDLLSWCQREIEYEHGAGTLRNILHSMGFYYKQKNYLPIVAERQAYKVARMKDLSSPLPGPPVGKDKGKRAIVWPW